MIGVNWSNTPGVIGAFKSVLNDSLIFVLSKEPSTLDSKPGFKGVAGDGREYHVFSECWTWHAKPVSWNGEGLPPVGVDARLKSECKFTEGTRLESFLPGTIVYVGGHANFGGCDLAVIAIKGRHFCGTIIPRLLEPIRTPEQIAAEEQEAAIKDMTAHVKSFLGAEVDANVSYTHDVMRLLYIAGFRKEPAQ